MDTFSDWIKLLSLPLGERAPCGVVGVIGGCWGYLERPTCVEDSLGQDGAELGHDVVVLVVDDLGVELPELVDLGQRGETH